ncbi:MAG: hypothetical protein GY874_00630 [Desulfobacteraceae bacterium]|nr:hypothetical protein [Desulfobacteraceae bacterium]
MTKISHLIGYACVLFAAIILGNWFIAELKKKTANRGNWYNPLLTIPGIIIIIIVLAMPIAARLLR